MLGCVFVDDFVTVGIVWKKGCDSYILCDRVLRGAVMEGY